MWISINYGPESVECFESERAGLGMATTSLTKLYELKLHLGEHSNEKPS